MGFIALPLVQRRLISYGPSPAHFTLATGGLSALDAIKHTTLRRNLVRAVTQARMRFENKELIGTILRLASMSRRDLLQEAKSRFMVELNAQIQGCGDVSLQDDVVVSRLSPAEAIGDADRDDLPILKGKEVLMQALYKGSAGQAFTAAKGGFRKTLGEVLELSLCRSFERAALIATMNAVLRHLGRIENTVHCRDDGPKRCATSFADWIAEQRAERVGLVGLQPALLEALVKVLGPEKVMASDLTEVGSICCQVKILDGMKPQEMFEHCQLILISGSTLANGTIDGLMELAESNNCRVVFYGTTVAGAAYLLGLDRMCPCST